MSGAAGVRLPAHGGGAAAVALADLYTAERQLAARRSALHKRPERRHSIRQQVAERKRLAERVATMRAAFNV